MELNAVSFRAISSKTVSVKTILHRTLLTFALLTTAVPAWCVKEAPAAEAPKTVNINTADAATLAEVLTGVGLAKAEAIIAYRKEHGGFKSVEQLSEVKGIGEKLVKANQERIVVK
jgi:competence protein ComEA